MKKIIFSNYDSPNNPHYGGGGAIAIHEVAKRLVKDFSITVITGDYQGAKNETIDGVEYKRIGFKKIHPQLAQLVFQFLLPVYVMKENFDLWIESFTPPFSTAMLPGFTKKPIIGLAHLLGGEDMYKKYKIPFQVLENFGLKFYKYCITPTQNVKNKILSKNSKINVVVISNGVDEEYLKEHSAPENKHILFIGRLDINQKGLDILLDAYMSIADRISLPLVIAGSGVPQDETMLKKNIRKLNLQDKVKLVGKVSGDDKKKLFQESAFVVMPSRYETFGMVILEAFAFAVPVITTNLPDLSWIPDIAGDKVDVDNIEQLANAMLHLAENPDQRRIMGSAGRSYAVNYSWDNVAKKYREVISKLI